MDSFETGAFLSSSLSHLFERILGHILRQFGLVCASEVIIKFIAGFDFYSDLDQGFRNQLLVTRCAFSKIFVTRHVRY